MLTRNDSPEWEAILCVFQDSSEGHVFSHDELKKLLGIPKPDPKDFSDSLAFHKAMQRHHFDYWTMIDQLRNDLLERKKLYIVSSYGEGYSVAPASDQVPLAYDKAVNEIERALSSFDTISSNVRSVSPEIQARDNDLRARMSQVKLITTNLRKQ